MFYPKTLFKTPVKSLYKVICFTLKTKKGTVGSFFTGVGYRSLKNNNKNSFFINKKKSIMHFVCISTKKETSFNNRITGIFFRSYENIAIPLFNNSSIITNQLPKNWVCFFKIKQKGLVKLYFNSSIKL